MKLTDRHTNNAAKFYAFSFILVAVWYAWHRLTLVQISPVFFAPKPDMTGHLIFATGLQHALLNNTWLQLFFDGLFFILSPLLVFCFIKKYVFLPILAWLTILWNIVYCYLLSCMSFLSMEPFIAWFFVPVLFTALGKTGFYFRLHMLRIIFILFFASAGLWKIRSGGAFNIEQLSGILLHQYAAVIAAGDYSFFTKWVVYLINHPTFSFILYWIVLLAELFFVAGLFTRKFDKILLWILVGFICFDYFLMEINYFSWLPFALLFYYSRYDLPGEES